MPPKTISDVCSVPGCGKPHHAKGYCRTHWLRVKKYGRLHKIRGGEKSKCSVPECENLESVRGLCELHYHRQYVHGRLHKVRQGDKRSHPLYIPWFERKQNRVLCEEWLDFWTFAEGVGQKPGSNYFLVRLRGDEPFGPTNFKWQEHLKREEGESAKAWHRRKWEARNAANPSWQRKRELKRKYGMAPQQYDEMFEAQNGLCAICEKPESHQSPAGTVILLAVDHNHATGKIRALLCRRCNQTLGHLREDLTLLRAFAAYIRKHNGEKENK